MNNNDKVEIITPPNTLAMKVSKEGSGCVDKAALDRAEAVIAGMANSYLEWVEADLVKISTAHKELSSHRDDPFQYLDNLYQIAHDMKGQGGAFNYGLITILGDDLCRFIEGKKNVSLIDLEVINLYINTMQIVIAKRMNGDGGEEGEKVLSGLVAVVGKITA